MYNPDVSCILFDIGHCEECLKISRVYQAFPITNKNAKEWAKER